MTYECYLIYLIMLKCLAKRIKIIWWRRAFKHGYKIDIMKLKLAKLVASLRIHTYFCSYTATCPVDKVPAQVFFLLLFLFTTKISYKKHKRKKFFFWRRKKNIFNDKLEIMSITPLRVTKKYRTLKLKLKY